MRGGSSAVGLERKGSQRELKKKSKRKITGEEARRGEEVTLSKRESPNLGLARSEVRERGQVGYPTWTKPRESRNINRDRLPIYGNSVSLIELSQQQKVGQGGVKFLAIMSTPQR
ncbi:hypothetical protein ElyMa_000969200 [Elysia marginata]|uniref:Uncharacterized protein n=1 Tax=Elysia marginata TaxID=1093978 RepID=A0AAV4HHZ9_9GAST|nr:hypothetical protein ElyMa_000969200 [Elysia marginata]